MFTQVQKVTKAVYDGLAYVTRSISNVGVKCPFRYCTVLGEFKKKTPLLDIMTISQLVMLFKLLSIAIILKNPPTMFLKIPSPTRAVWCTKHSLSVIFGSV